MIRAARPADIDRLVAITLASYAQTFVPLVPDADWHGFDEAFFRARFETRLASVRVIEHAGDIAGFAMMSSGHLDMFFIDPSRQGAGLGAGLLAAMGKQGAATLECFAANAGARRFYERHGWRLVAEYRRVFAGTDCAFCRYEKP
jgi:GNAT superfamily N-acetyltransferase